MNRRSFLRKAMGGAAGVGAVVLGAKNLGSPSIGDRKEAAQADEFDNVALQAKWSINPPYAWGSPHVYPRTIRNSFGREGDMSSEVEWTDGLTTSHKGFAKMYDGPMSDSWQTSQGVLMSEDGKRWRDIHVSARLWANCTSWVWRQEQVWGGHLRNSWGGDWLPGEQAYDSGIYLRNAIYTDPPIDIGDTKVPGRMILVEGGRETHVPVHYNGVTNYVRVFGT